MFSCDFKKKKFQFSIAKNKFKPEKKKNLKQEFIFKTEFYIFVIDGVFIENILKCLKKINRHTFFLFTFSDNYELRRNMANVTCSSTRYNFN